MTKLTNPKDGDRDQWTEGRFVGKMGSDYYQILGVERSIKEDELKESVSEAHFEMASR